MHVEVPSRAVHPRRPAARRLAGAAATALLLLGVLLAVPSCGPSLPHSPEALFARVQELNAAGRTADIWALLHPEAQETFKRNIEGTREWLRTNPGSKNENLIRKQFHCEPKEFLELDYRELYVRENQGRERWMEGARITDTLTDPNRPHEVIIYWKTALDYDQHFRTRFEDGEGYYLMGAE